MDWQEELQIEVIERNLKVAEAFDLLVCNLSKQQLEEFAGQLIKWEELSPASGLLEDG